MVVRANKDINAEGDPLSQSAARALLREAADTIETLLGASPELENYGSTCALVERLMERTPEEKT